MKPRALFENANQIEIYSVKEADKFFHRMYSYYVAKGIGAILLSEFCSIVSLGFTIIFSVFLLGFVNWQTLLDCHDEESCHEGNQHLIRNPFHQPSSMYSFFLMVYGILLAAVWIWKCMKSVETVCDSLDMSNFYSEKLGLKLVDLQYMQWYEVLERLISIHNHGLCRIGPKGTITVHDVALYVMRNENYLIGLINKNTLDLVVPWWISPFASDELFLTQSLEWSLSFCIMDYMYDDGFELSAEFLNDVAGLQWRFQVVGLIHFLLLPFMLIFMAMNFFLHNAQQFHSSRAYLGPRQWTPLALWKFREFNELPHIFEERINKSYASANEYIATFHNPYMAITARCMTYIAGSFVATLLLVSVLSDGALLYIHIADYNLLWYLGIFSACYAGARSLVPDETKESQSCANLLQTMCSHTHYFPCHWEDRANSVEVKDEMCNLFQYKIQIFLIEVLSVVLTPAVLCFSLPPCAHSILNFIRDHSKCIDGIGAVCDYSLFNVAEYGDENFCTENSGILDKSQRPNDGKLEKSMLNFHQAHPNYDGGDGARALFGRLNAFRELKKMQREQVLVSTVMDKSITYSASKFAGVEGIHSNRMMHMATGHRSDDTDRKQQQQHLEGPPRPLMSSGQGTGIQSSLRDSRTRTGINMVDTREVPMPVSPCPEHSPVTAGLNHSDDNREGTRIAGRYSNAESDILNTTASAGEVSARDMQQSLLVVTSSVAELRRHDAQQQQKRHMQKMEDCGLSGNNDRNNDDHNGDDDDDDNDEHMPFAHSGLHTSRAFNSTSDSIIGTMLQHDGHCSSNNNNAMASSDASDPPPPLLLQQRLSRYTSVGSDGLPDGLPVVSEGGGGNDIELSGLRHPVHTSLFESNFHYPPTGEGPHVISSSQYSYRNQQADYGLGASKQPDLPSVLRSILRQENIDYENDFYWMTKFNGERQRDASTLEKSLLSLQQSTMMMESPRSSSIDALNLPVSPLPPKSTSRALRSPHQSGHLQSQPQGRLLQQQQQQQQRSQQLPRNSIVGAVNWSKHSESEIGSAEYENLVAPSTIGSPRYHQNVSVGHQQQSVRLGMSRAVGGLDRLAENDMEDSL
mmetsp:Transcript_9901/g.16301  ORF Transcript_9901/g.16301 Transcript_9901/m.16301 type:complete len:1086 (-) Transcript_9901:92-3349(-)